MPTTLTQSLYSKYFLGFSIIMIVCIKYARGQDQGLTLKDRDGNTYNMQVMADGKKWMTANLSINIPGSFDYEKAEQKNKQYGRLYSWKSAQEGCTALGDGWRLPSKEEWQKMAKGYGGFVDDSKDGGKAAYFALITGGSSGFNAVYGGRRDTDGTYSRVDAHGFYWTSTESDTTTAWLYNFGNNGKLLNRHSDGNKDWALSVRCTKSY